MSGDKGLFFHNIIAVIWDFDRTLSPHYMQKPIFEAYGVDEKRFWDEVSKLPAYYKRAGVKVHKETCYLGHLLSYVKAGIMPDLSNKVLRALGGNIPLFPGLPDAFRRYKDLLETPEFQEGDLRLEHYVVSTGLYELIAGSAVAPEVEGIWASSFIESPAEPGADLSKTPEPSVVNQIAGLLDHTTKTRALFEINKGVNKLSGISVNDSIPEEDRRVPFRNMIYVADGPSDIPCFSIVRKFGGLTYAVYGEDSHEQYVQALRLQETGRVDHSGPADYRAGSPTDKWLQFKIKTIAQGIMDRRQSATRSKVGREPVHLPDDSK